MGLGDLVDNIKSKIPFLNKDEADDSGDLDFGSDDLNFGDESPAGGKAEQPAEDQPSGDNPFGEEQPAQEQEAQEPFSEPPANQPFSEPQAQPFNEPRQNTRFQEPQSAPPFAPQPQFQQPPQYPVQQQPSADTLKIEVDNIKQRIENLMHKFDTISAELDTIRSENDFEKALLQRYDFYLRDIVGKIDNMEKQHEAMWNELRTKHQ